MDVKEHIDPVAAVEGLLSEMLQKAFQDDGLRQHLRLSQISQGSTVCGYPRWYLWLEDKEGVYSLTIEEGQVLRSVRLQPPGKTVESFIPVSALIVVRYFPDAQEEVFDSLSCFEQIARMSSAFDCTGTPTFEGGREIDHSYYVTGQIEVVMYASPAEADFFCSAPERWRDHRLDGLSFPDEHGEAQQMVRPGEVDRDFPGWDITLHVFQKMISLFCSLTGQIPCGVGFSTKPSVHFEIDTDQAVFAVPDPAITDCRFGVSFLDDLDKMRKVERDRIFKKMLSADEYHFDGIWQQKSDIPFFLICDDWWTITKMHRHTCSDHLCSCYKDEKDSRGNEING